MSSSLFFENRESDTDSVPGFVYCCDWPNVESEFEYEVGASPWDDCCAEVAWGVVDERRRVNVPFGPLFSLLGLLDNQHLTRHVCFLRMH
jgi:hypothetical protein